MPSWSQFVCCIGGLAFVAGCSSAPANSLGEQPQPDAAVTSLSTGSIQAEGLKADKPAAPAGIATAVVPEPTFDFGSQPTDSELQHRFRIRNEGTAPLTLEKGTSTCSCTVSSLHDRVIPPGETGWVTLEWNVGRKVGPFSHAAMIKTNDPRNPLLELRVSGLAQAEVVVEPDELLWDELLRDQPAQDEVVVTSQAWPEFRIENIRCSVQGITWESAPVDADRLKRSEAKSGHAIQVRVPAELTKNPIDGWLEFDVVPPVESQPKIPHKIRLTGFCPKGIFFSGACQEAKAAVFGTVRQGVGKKCNVILKAKGYSEAFHIVRTESEPSFVKCEVTPILAQGRNVGLFRVAIEIPADAPECIYQTPDVGRLRLFTNDPTKPELTIYLEFSVLP